MRSGSVAPAEYAQFGHRTLAEITPQMIVEYRNQRREQFSKRNPKRKVKGATVNRELECLRCLLGFAAKHKYIAENPASGVEHFDERQERAPKRTLTPEEEERILKKAPPYLRVGIVLLLQTGGRTYSEIFSLCWDQVDFQNRVIHLGGKLKTADSAQPLPLTKIALETLQHWKAERSTHSAFVFPSPADPSKPIGNVRRAWTTTLKRAGVPYFPIYNLRHVFCTRLSGVAPDAVLQQAMRHSSPETKRRYQLGMGDQVRESQEKVNKRIYRPGKVLRFYDVRPETENAQLGAVRN